MQVCYYTIGLFIRFRILLLLTSSQTHGVLYILIFISSTVLYILEAESVKLQYLDSNSNDAPFFFFTCFAQSLFFFFFFRLSTRNAGVFKRYNRAYKMCIMLFEAELLWGIDFEMAILSTQIL